MSEEGITRRTLGDVRDDRTDWKKLESMTEEVIDEAARSDPDAQPTDAEFWKDAELVMPEPKEPVTLRIDKDVVDWFRKQGRGYQTRINAVLRAYMTVKTGKTDEERPS